MEERTAISKNNNKKRRRLKVKDNRKSKKIKQIQNLKKKDRKMKLSLSVFTFLVVASLLTIALVKRNNLNAKRYEYNTLQADIVSYELQRDRLNSRLEEAIDLNLIQRYALEELGMVYKDDDNTVKLNVDRN
ncbi:MAG: hypothetical protein E7C95_03575 [Anaerococcus prevotii]|uniref:hypothetical protein n=1 Tax=Anaerococcus prevotii TaxID=33034 RepID=UPI0028FDC5E1|nr:hypothetical protein [Anaerococcus prevotii]MDU2558038.1 hypothetical protein [Anaerococcus prevotii]